MSIWYNKKEEEIIQRLKNTLESESLQFIGKFTNVEEKDFGFFKDVRSISGVRKYYPTNEGEPDDFNNRPLEKRVKLYALIISNEDYVDTTLFDNLQKVTEAFDNIPGTRIRFDNQDRLEICGCERVQTGHFDCLDHFQNRNSDDGKPP